MAKWKSQLASAMDTALAVLPKVTILFSTNSAATFFFLFVHVMIAIVGLVCLTLCVARRETRRVLVVAFVMLASLCGWQLLWSNDDFSSLIYPSDTFHL